MIGVKRATLVVAGVLAFWIPGLLVQQVFQSSWGTLAANILAVICPLLVYRTAKRSWGLACFPAICILAGMYVLGPTLTSLYTDLTSGFHQGSTFASPMEYVWFVAYSLFPPLTWVWAGDTLVIFGMLPLTAIFVRLAILDWNRAKGVNRG